MTVEKVSGFLAVAVGAVVGGLSFVGCDNPRRCTDETDCFDNQICQNGYCTDVDSGLTADGEDRSDDASEPPTDSETEDGVAGDTDSTDGRATDDVDDGGSQGDDSSSDGAAAFVGVSAGSTHSCGLLDDGEVVCWGSPDRMGDVPSADFDEISGGYHTNCGRTSEGDKLRCWGEEEFSEWHRSIDHALGLEGSFDVGNGTYVKTNRYAPIACVYRGNNSSRVECLSPGGSEDDDENDFNFSVELGSQNVRVAASDHFGCAVHSNGLDCGAPTSHGAGVPTGSNEFDPPFDPDGIACSPSFCCVVGDNGLLECFGNEAGVVDVPDGTFDQIVAGYRFACARKQDDRRIQCWGADASHLGDLPDVPISSMAAGKNHVCVVSAGPDTEGLVDCFGPGDDPHLQAPSPSDVD